MKFKMISLLSAAVLSTTVSSANASSYRLNHHHYAHRYAFHYAQPGQRQLRTAQPAVNAWGAPAAFQPAVAQQAYSSHPSGDRRPSAWCGWEMRRLVGSDPGPAYNLARNWTHWGQPVARPIPGAIGVMPHHVFKVLEVLGAGSVLAISGNDGHAVRIRPRSTAGVIAWRI